MYVASYTLLMNVDDKPSHHIPRHHVASRFKKYSKFEGPEGLPEPFAGRVVYGDAAPGET